MFPMTGTAEGFDLSITAGGRELSMIDTSEMKTDAMPQLQLRPDAAGLEATLQPAFRAAASIPRTMPDGFPMRPSRLAGADKPMEVAGS
jgi:hypothetical protein